MALIQWFAALPWKSEGFLRLLRQNVDGEAQKLVGNEVSESRNGLSIETSVEYWLLQDKKQLLIATNDKIPVEIDHVQPCPSGARNRESAGQGILSPRDWTTGLFLPTDIQLDCSLTQIDSISTKGNPWYHEGAIWRCPEDSGMTDGYESSQSRMNLRGTLEIDKCVPKLDRFPAVQESNSETTKFQNNSAEH